MQASAISLLCQWANNLTPTAVFSWEPSATVAFWKDSINPAGTTGNLATFNATADPSTVTWLQFTDAGSPDLSALNNLSSLPLLSYLQADNVSTSSLSTIDLTGCGNLIELVVSNQDSMSSIDTSPCPLLQRLSIDGTSITTIDVTGNLGLQYLNCKGLFSAVPTLNVSGCIQLATILCDGNGFTTLNFSGLVSLATLDCFLCPSLTTITLTGCGALTALDCNSCNLTGTLDVSPCAPALTTLNCSSNASLTTLTLTGCTALVTLDYSSCALASIDFTGLVSLMSVNGAGNAITSILGLGVFSTPTGTITINVSSIALSFPNLTTIGGDFSLSGYSSVSLPSLITAGATLSLVSADNHTVTLPSLTSVGFFLSCNTSTGLTSFSAPSLISTTDSCDFDGCTSLTSVSFPALQTCGFDLRFNGCTNLLSISLPSLVLISDVFTANGCTALTSISCANGASIGSLNLVGDTALLSFVASGVSFGTLLDVHGCSNMTTFTMGAAVVPAAPLSWNWNSCKLNQGDVDAILALCAAVPSSNSVIDLGGGAGTNSSPTGGALNPDYLVLIGDITNTVTIN